MNKKTLLVATHNKGKILEISQFLSNLPYKITSLSNVGITEDVKEDGETYKENSQKKALFYAKLSNLPSIADDGGIEIVALNNQPGIHSRRWLGYLATDEEIINHMKKVSKELPDNNRKAFFKTIVSFALPNGKVWSVSGEVEGIIAKEPYIKELKGYPYRSFFYLPSLKKYYHETELTIDEQKLYNHRYKALQKLKPIIKRVLSI